MNRGNRGVFKMAMCIVTPELHWNYNRKMFKKKNQKIRFKKC